MALPEYEKIANVLKSPPRPRWQISPLSKMLQRQAKSQPFMITSALASEGRTFPASSNASRRIHRCCDR